MTVVEHHRQDVSPRFADHLADHGERVAVVTATGSLTYAALDAEVAAAAERLGDGRRLVLLTVANTVDAVIAYLAALRSGNPVLLAAAADAVAVRSLREAYDPDVVIDADAGWEVQERRRTSAHVLHPDLALLLSTSGSTGSPKLVRLSAGNLGSNAAAIAGYLGLTAADRAITTLPMQYCYGLSVVNSHLAAGAGIVLTERSVVDRCFWDLFRRSGATGLAGVPHTFDLLDRVGFDTMAVPTLRYVTQAGGRMHPETVRRYARLGERDGWDLFVMYGQTEATARMAYLPPALAATHPGAVGVPIPGGALRVDAPDDDGVGELVYRGDNVMLGYAERRDDLRLGATVDELRTGDLARLGASGLYEVVGRRSRFVKPYGLRVDLDRIERLLADHRVAASCTGDDDGVVVALEGVDDVEATRRLVRDAVGLPRSAVRVLSLPEIPRLASGKPDHAALRRLAADQPVAAQDPTGGDVGAAVRGAFATVLGVEASGEDTFVGLGGDSLSYVEMSIRLEEVLGGLPRDWHATPLDELVAGAAGPPVGGRLDTTVVLRALAIVLVVGTHVDLWRLAGGAHTLLAVAGLNFARFQRRPATMLASAARIAVPSMCWIGVVAAVSDAWRWPNALLVNGWLGAPGDRWGYWYVEVVVQLLAVLALLFALPAVRALDRRAPFLLAVGAVTAGLAVRFDVLVEVTTTRPTAAPHEVFWLFALGWAAAHADTASRRLLVSALTVAAVPGFFGHGPRELVVAAGILLLVWVPHLPVPRLAGRLVGAVAGASLHVYLTHFQVYPPLLRLHGPAVAVAGSVVVGVAVWLLTRRACAAGERALVRTATRLNDRRRPGAGSDRDGHGVPPSGTTSLQEALPGPSRLRGAGPLHDAGRDVDEGAHGTGQQALRSSG